MLDGSSRCDAPSGCVAPDLEEVEAGHELHCMGAPGAGLHSRVDLTPKEDLLAWEEGTDCLPVQKEAQEKPFDLVPVTASGQIESVWARAGGGEPEPPSARGLVARDS
jgi:hypothetical protein